MCVWGVGVGGGLLHECPSEDHPLISYTNVSQLQVNVCFRAEWLASGGGGIPFSLLMIHSISMLSKAPSWAWFGYQLYLLELQDCVWNDCTALVCLTVFFFGFNWCRPHQGCPYLTESDVGVSFHLQMTWQPLSSACLHILKRGLHFMTLTWAKCHPSAVTTPLLAEIAV